MFALATSCGPLLGAALEKSTTDAGIMMLPLLVGMPAGSMLNGFSFRRLRDPKWLMVVAGVLLGIGCAVLSQLSLMSSNLQVFIGLLLCGLGLGALSQCQILFIQIITPSRNAGVATGLISTARTYGGAIGSAAFGLTLEFGGVEAAFLAGLVGCAVIAMLIAPLSFFMEMNRAVASEMLR